MIIRVIIIIRKINIIKEYRIHEKFIIRKYKIKIFNAKSLRWHEIIIKSKNHYHIYLANLDPQYNIRLFNLFVVI